MTPEEINQELAKMRKQRNLGAFIFIALFLTSVYCYLDGCNRPIQPTKLTAREDSLLWITKELEKQLGFSDAIGQKYKDEAYQSKRDLNNYKPIYITRVERIISNAPDTCYPYLLALKQQCDTITAKYDSTIVKMDRVVKADSTVKEDYKRLVDGKDKLIAVKDSIKDSLLVVIAKFPKKLKCAKWQGRFEGGLFMQVINSVKNNIGGD
jgi:hypothetical protein